MTLRLPTTSGWMVEWETGKTWTDKKGRVHVPKGAYESTSYEKVVAKKEELEKQGFKVIGIYECIQDLQLMQSNL